MKMKLLVVFSMLLQATTPHSAEVTTVIEDDTFEYPYPLYYSERSNSIFLF